MTKTLHSRLGRKATLKRNKRMPKNKLAETIDMILTWRNIQDLQRLSEQIP